MTKTPYIPINPLTLDCPQCAAKAGQVCDMLKGEIEVIHVKRIKAAAIKDVAVKKATRR